MTKCKNCGKEHDGDFCPFCGTKAEEGPVCPKCGAEIEEGANFCRHCGNQISATATQEIRGLKNETKIDFAYNVRMLGNMTGKKTGIMLLVATLILLLLGAAMFALEYFWLGGDSPDYSFAVTCIVLGVLLGIFALIFKPLIKSILKKNMQGKESLNVYVFTEEGYEVVTRLNDGTESKATGNYGSFTEAKEYKDMWLLYINKATVFSVSKDGMTQGTVEELTALFKRALGVRYKVCYKK